MSLETAGARLKKIRQERGLSLEDIQKRTKIHLNILRAIEGDSLSNLSPIYLKGFIKIYCGCLGLDAGDFIGHPAEPEQPKPALHAAVGKPIGSRIEKKPSFIKGASVKLGSLKPRFDFKKIVLVFAAVLIVFFVIRLARFVLSRPHKDSGKAHVVSPVPSAPKSGIKTAKFGQDLAAGFNLGIFARGKSWISVKIDGKTVFHGVLARGRSETWRVADKAELSLGNAGAVELQINDQRFNNLGRSGQPLKNVLINKEGLKISR
jgi:transcriptional regulator with XRE-family HTH domain